MTQQTRPSLSNGTIEHRKWSGQARNYPKIPINLCTSIYALCTTRRCSIHKTKTQQDTLLWRAMRACDMLNDVNVSNSVTNQDTLECVRYIYINTKEWKYFRSYAFRQIFLSNALDAILGLDGMRTALIAHTRRSLLDTHSALDIPVIFAVTIFVDTLHMHKRLCCGNDTRTLYNMQ